MKALLLAALCLLPLSIEAQPPRQPRPAVLPPGQTPAEEAPLGENIVIRLQGTTTTGTEVDLSLTGVGPRFTADQMTENDTFLQCHYHVSGTESGYRVNYTVSSRIKVPVGPNATNYEYRDVSISGTVLCAADRPLVLLRNGTKPLQLTISKEGGSGSNSEE